MARHTALRLLSRHPEIARDSLYTAVVCGEIQEVERILAQRPQAASQKSGVASADRSDAGDSRDRFKNIANFLLVRAERKELTILIPGLSMIEEMVDGRPDLLHGELSVVAALVLVEGRALMMNGPNATD